MNLASILVACHLCGCAASPVNPQAPVATTVAITANAALPVLVDVYRSEGLEAIRAAPDRATAEKHLAEIDATWAPIWKAWQLLSKAEGDWASALESKSDTAKTLGVVKKAYCDLMAVWPKNVPVRPIPVFPCVSHE